MIKRIRIRNFRSLIEVTVDLAPTTVLIGRSGTGKSNFISAVRFFRDFVSAGGRNAQDWQSIRPIPTRSGGPRVELLFDIPGVDESFTYELETAEQPDGSITEEALSLGDQVLFHQRLRKWVVEPRTHPVPDPAQLVIGRLSSIPEVVLAHTAIAAGIGCYAFPSTVLCRSNRNAGFALTPRTQYPGTPRGFADNGENYLEVMATIATNLHDLTVRKSISSALRKLNSSVLAVEPIPAMNPENAVVSHEFNGLRLAIPLEEESEGFRRFYAHFLALYQTPGKQVLLFEEPDSGIYPGALAVLAEEMLASYDDGRGQVIITTHSPGLLDQFPADSIRVVEIDNNQTRIGPVVAEQMEALRASLLTPGELLTVDPARVATEDAPAG